MEKSATIGAICKALISFQSTVGKIRKDSINPFFKSNYASLANILDVIQKPLADCGLSFSQFPEGDEGLTTILMHGESGEYMQSTYQIHASKKDPQGIGSAITYARRYALGAVLGLNIDEDDDGNAASPPAKQNAPQPQQSSIPAELQSAIDKLQHVNSAAEMKNFAALLPESVRANSDFRAAATARQKHYPKS